MQALGYTFKNSYKELGLLLLFISIGVRIKMVVVVVARIKMVVVNATFFVEAAFCC